MEIPVKIDEADDRGAVQFNAAVEVVLMPITRNRESIKTTAISNGKFFCKILLIFSSNKNFL